jgi:two-component system, OmpR family, sensor kinase
VRALSFKTRLWLGQVAVLAVMLVLASFGADWALRRIVLGQVIDDAILSLASTEAAALESDHRQPVRVHEGAPGAGPPSFLRLDKFVQVIDLDGKVVARSATLGTLNLPAPSWLLARLRNGETVFTTATEIGDEPVRMVSLPVTVGPMRHAVQVGMSLDDAYAALRAGRWLFLSMSTAMLIGIGLTGSWLARRALRPIDEIVSQAKRIGEASLAERLPHPGTRDEIGRLVETLNDMLGRLDRSFDVQRQFTGDASHELRSPLARLRAELEVTLRRPRPAEEYVDTLRSCLDEVQRLQRLVEELLELARIDARQEPERPETVPLREIVEASVFAIAPEGERRGVATETASLPDLLVRAAPAAAKVALANILHNAVKFSPPGGMVKILVTETPDEAIVAVSDTGPGVAPDELPRLFQRFYRGHASPSTDEAGVGLGLAIARALIERQGGRISVKPSTDKGATFTLHLPRA